MELDDAGLRRLPSRHHEIRVQPFPCIRSSTWQRSFKYAFNSDRFGVTGETEWVKVEMFTGQLAEFVVERGMCICPFLNPEFLLDYMLKVTSRASCLKKRPHNS